MRCIPTLEDLVGIEHCKLGFYQELQQKVEQLRTSNQKLEKKRQEIQAVLDGMTDLMLVLSEDLKIQRVNHVFEQWFPRINPLGRYCYEVFRGKPAAVMTALQEGLLIGVKLSRICVFIK